MALLDLGLGLAGGYGSKPSVAQFRPVNYQRVQEKSLEGNLANWGMIADLGEQYRKYFMENQEALLPGYGNLLERGVETTNQLLDIGQEYLTGQIPKDVQEQIQRTSAYKSFSGGYGGSGMAKGLTARDLGLTSLDLISRGADMIGRGGNSAQQWASLSRPGIMNPSSFLVTPQQQAELDMQNRILQQQSQQYAFNVEAAPDPMLKGVSDTAMANLGMIMGLLGSSGGGGAAGAATGGGGMGIMSLLSDARTKENIETIGTSPSGIPIVLFNYIGNATKYLGVLAQDLLRLGRSDAVINGQILRVNYSKIDVPFICLA